MGSPPPPLDRPLAGIRVLDFSRLIPGPYCTHLLAGLGADVVKVESPLVGDWVRCAPAEFGYGDLFDHLNRGKRSLAVNYRAPAGRALVLRLAASADVLVESHRPGMMARWRLGPSELLTANPRLVYCSLSGYGDGEAGRRAGHDLNFLALGGLLGLLADRSGRPVTPGIPIADLASGLWAAMAIEAALIRRAATGVGGAIDLAILDAVLSWVAPFAGAAPALGRGLPCYNVYDTADGGWLALGAIEPTFWLGFCRLAGRPDLAGRQFDPAAVPEVAAVFRGRTRDAWLRLAADADDCLTPVNSVAEAWAEPAVTARLAGLAGVPHDGRPAPELGRDTDDVLRAVGVRGDELEALHRDGVVGAGAAASRVGDRMARLVRRSATTVAVDV